jgi:cysteinyl-tRNA synthetase
MIALGALSSLPVSLSSSIQVEYMEEQLYGAMNDDFNSPIAIAHLFEAVKWVNLIIEGKETITRADLDRLTTLLHAFVYDIFGLKDESNNDSTTKIDGLVNYALELRQQAKLDKNYALSDDIRDKLKAIGFEIKDGKDGTTYSIL